MPSSPHLTRAQLLMDQGRTDMAEQELRRALAEDPHDFYAHALLALCLAEGGKARGGEALSEAREAVGLAPDLGFSHYALARVHLAAGRDAEAERAIREAIALDPDEPDFRGVLAAILLDRRRWAEALEEADRGLEIEPDHVLCANLRATALVHLGRKGEAGATLRQALSRDPENAFTHANQGWALLHRGDRRGAMEHFRESLRLEPNNDWARAGLVEALKAGNPLYAAMLRYFLWMTRLDRRTQWMIVLGGFLGYRVVLRTARSNPEWAPFLYPLMAAYVLFVLLSWTADAFFNFVLFLSPTGRHALSREQRTGAMLMGAAVASGVGFGVAALLTGAEVAVMGALMSLLLLVPLAASLRARPGTTRRVVSALTGALALAAAAAVVLAATGDGATASTLFSVVMLGSVVMSWVGNFTAGGR